MKALLSDWQVQLAIGIGVLILGILIGKYFVAAFAKARAEASAITAHVHNAVHRAPAVDPALSAVIANAPAAPAAVADAPPPATAANPVDSGGTALVTQWNDKVVAKHRELDAIIAAGKQAQSYKDALTATQAELDKMTA